MFGSLRLWAYTCVRVGPVRTRMCMPGCVGTNAASLCTHSPENSTKVRDSGARLGREANAEGKEEEGGEERRGRSHP